MSFRFAVIALTAAFLSLPASAQTAPKPAPNTPPPAAQPTTTPKPAAAVAEDEEKTTSGQVKVCNEKWKIEKAKPGAKTGAKAYHIFMGNCL